MYTFSFLTYIRYSIKNFPDLRYIPRLLGYIVISILMLPFHWVELLVYGSRIKKHKLEHPPVIILGHWRSGTTYLQRLLCAHNHTAYLTQYEALLPLGTSIHSFVFRPVVQFFFSAFKMQHPAHQLPMTVDFP